jgi:hypothetical protein
MLGTDRDETEPDCSALVGRVRVQDARKCTLYDLGGKSRLTLRVEAELRALF